MQKAKKIILLKLTGSLFAQEKTKTLQTSEISKLVTQILNLQDTHQFGIVVGGGNLFHGNQDGKRLGISPNTSHTIGMLSTVINGLFLKEIIEQHNGIVSHFCALHCPEISKPMYIPDITSALANNHIILFTGGTGNPFFTTDTNAVLRALQIKADEIWKGTSVDGIYTKDPKRTTDAILIPSLSYKQALEQKLAIMDTTAYTLAEEHKQLIRVFNIFSPNALINVTQNINIGSTIQ